MSEPGLTGGASIPYPVNCLQQAWLGAEYQHAKLGDKTVPAYTFPTYIEKGPGGYVISPSGGGDLATSAYYTIAPGIAPFGSFLGSVPQGPWTSAGTENLSVCEKTGFKNVAAVRQWHGRLGFIDDEPGYSDICYVAGSGSSSGFLTPLVWPVALPVTAIPNVHYLELAVQIYDSNPVGHASYVSDFSVNPLTGENTCNSANTSISAGQWAMYGDQCIPDPAGIDPRSWLPEISMNQMMEHFGQFIALTVYGKSIDYCTVSGSSLATGLTYQLYMVGASWVAESISISCSAAGGSFSRTLQLANPAYVPAFVQSASISNTQATYYSCLTDIYGNKSLINGSAGGTSPATATLSTPYSSSDVLNDITDNLLSTWNLADDLIYPWRTGISFAAPLVNRNEHPASVVPNLSYTKYMTDYSTNPPTDNSLWYDTDCRIWKYGESYSAGNELVLLVDGSIYGGPSAIYAPDLMWRHEQFCFQANDYQYDSITNTFSLSGQGMTVTAFNGSVPPSGADVPLTATQWTDAMLTQWIPPGASIMYGNQIGELFNVNPPALGYWTSSDTDALVMVKYAEIKERYLATNWGRPAGQDKFQIDETSTLCKVSGGGSSYTVTGSATVSSGDTWGGGSVGGFYTGCSLSGGTLTLGTKIFNVPTSWPFGWPTANGIDGATVIGKLRWPSCPALLGRVPGSTSGSTFTFVTPQPQFGMTIAGTESVDIYDSTMNQLAYGVTATRVTDSTFTTPSSYPAAAWVIIHGSPAWYFNSSWPRGNCVSLLWEWDGRTNGEYYRVGGSSTGMPMNQTNVSMPVYCGPGITANSNLGFGSFAQVQFCFPNIQCAPCVVCFSPNTDSTTGFDHFPNGQYMWFGGVALDDIYASRYQLQVQQTMIDPYWQTPHTPCGLSGSWEQDNGTCIGGGGITYYPFAPLVEAELFLPGATGGAQSIPGYGNARNEEPTWVAGALPGYQMLWPDPTLYVPGSGGVLPNTEGIQDWILRANLIANASCFGSFYGGVMLP